jgi:hypothetical protein
MRVSLINAVAIKVEEKVEEKIKFFDRKNGVL